MFCFNSTTGELTRIGTCPLEPNPAFIMRHPTRKDVLYATTECIDRQGEVVTLEMRSPASLSVVARQPAGGKSTCYITIPENSKHMLAVNYWDARVTSLPFDAKCGTIASVHDTNVQPGAEYVDSTNPDWQEHWQFRQRWPHTHCIVTEPFTKRLHFVTDLGQDKLKESGQLVGRGHVDLPKGKGPRHLLFHPTLPAAYCDNELDSTVTMFRYNPKPGLAGSGATSSASVKSGAPAGTAESLEYFSEDASVSGSILESRQNLSSLPAEFQGRTVIHPNGVWKAASHSSEIRLHPSGKFLYVGNRGHDSLAVYAIDQTDGSLSVVQIAASGGRTPRNFNFDVTGRWMVVGNQDSNNLTVFAIDQDTGALRQEGSQVPLPMPNFVYALPLSDYFSDGDAGDGEGGERLVPAAAQAEACGAGACADIEGVEEAKEAAIAEPSS
eukprot:jgi/Mesvir1/12778/Mv22833-RA.1